MLDERKSAILRAVVEEYIETAQPVGSGHVAAAHGVDVSSATVRNEMAGLEAEGFLRQPHTSAGRVPTEKGYRFFVDHLRRPARLPAPSAEEVRAFFARAHGEVEQMLAETSRLLSNLTNLTSVVVAPGPAEATRALGAARRARPHARRCWSSCSATARSRSTRSTCPRASATSGSRRRPRT